MQDFEGSHLVFVAAGPDPFDVITNAVKYVFVLSSIVTVLEVSLFKYPIHCSHVDLHIFAVVMFGFNLFLSTCLLHSQNPCGRLMARTWS